MKQAIDYEVYRNATRRLIIFCILLFIINIGFLFYGYYLYLNKHAKTFYVTTQDGELIKVQPVKVTDSA